MMSMSFTGIFGIAVAVLIVIVVGLVLALNNR